MASYDKFHNRVDNAVDPARQAFLIVPDDINPLAIIPKAIRADTAGAVVFRAVDSDVDVTMNLAVGEVLPVRVAYVRATGTTVTALHGLA